MSSRRRSVKVLDASDLAPVSVTWDSRKQLFKKCIGRHRGADGVIRPRIFWLGPKQVPAIQKATVYRDVWRELEAFYGDAAVWDESAERTAEERLHNKTVGARVLAGYAKQLLADLGPFAPAQTQIDLPALPVPALAADSGVVTIGKVEAAYRGHVATYYRFADGSPTDEQKSIKLAIVPLLRLHANTPAEKFGPLALKAVRDEMVKQGWCRSYVNQQIGRVRRMLKWAVENELVPPSVFHGLQAVTGLRVGRSAAPEPDPIKPVPEDHVAAVRERVSETIRTMIDVQMLTGMRPGEVVRMRTCDIDRSADVWVYQPEHHKTLHHGHTREVFIGPKCQALLKPLLDEKRPTAYLFNPAEAEQERREQRSKNRKTPLSCGNRPGTKRTAKPKRAPGDRYDVSAYRRAIARACQAADAEARKKDPKLAADKVVVPAWHPHQLRHNAATRLRRDYGLEAAQVILGHRTLTATQIYAERNAEAARTVMASVG
jgi:integrase